LQRTVEYLQQYEIKDVVINVHHFADQVEEAIEKNKGWGSNIIISDERDEVLETGGGVIKAKEFLSNDTFLTINVDILTELNLKYFLSFHQQQQALITLAVSDRTTSRYLLFN
jgi:NDP-sugar pyrophosphorylase family protein